MPHFSKMFRKANTVQKKVRKKRRPFDATDLKPVKHATPVEIFGKDLKIKGKDKKK